MKITTYPDLYQKYKDKTIAFCGDRGVIVGYFIDTDDSLILFAQIDRTGIYGYFNYFITKYKIDIKDYHGEDSKRFFLVNKEDIDKERVKVIE